LKSFCSISPLGIVINNSINSSITSKALREQSLACYTSVRKPWVKAPGNWNFLGTDCPSKLTKIYACPLSVIIPVPNALCLTFVPTAIFDVSTSTAFGFFELTLLAVQSNYT